MGDGEVAKGPREPRRRSSGGVHWQAEADAKAAELLIPLSVLLLGVPRVSRRCRVPDLSCSHSPGLLGRGRGDVS